MILAAQISPTLKISINGWSMPARTEGPYMKLSFHLTEVC